MHRPGAADRTLRARGSGGSGPAPAPSPVPVPSPGPAPAPLSLTCPGSAPAAALAGAAAAEGPRAALAACRDRTSRARRQRCAHWRSAGWVQGGVGAGSGGSRGPRAERGSAGRRGRFCQARPGQPRGPCAAPALRRRERGCGDRGSGPGAEVSVTPRGCRDRGGGPEAGGVSGPGGFPTGERVPVAIHVRGFRLSQWGSAKQDRHDQIGLVGPVPAALL